MTRLLARLRAQDAIFRTLLSGAGSSFLLRAGGFGLGFVLQVITARTMPAESFGRFWYAAALLNTVSLVGAFGYDTATVRFVPHYLAREAWPALRGFLRHRTRRILAVAGAGALLLALAAVVLGPRLAPELRRTLLIGSVVIPLASFATVLEGSLRALKRARIAQVGLAIVRPGALIVLVLLLVGLGRTLSAPVVMAGHLAAYLLALGALTVWWRRALPPAAASAAPDAAEARDWASTARAMLLVTGFAVVLFQADIILTGMLLGTTAAGHYVVGSKIASLIVFVLTAVNFIAGPMISDGYSRGRPADIRRIAYLGVRLSAAASAVLTVGLLAFGDQLLRLFGSSFAEAYGPLAILAVGQLVNAVCGPVTLLLTMTGRHAIVARVLGSGAVLNVVLNVTLIPLVGITGGAIATAITNVVINLWLVLMVRRELGITTLAALLPRGSVGR